MKIFRPGFKPVVTDEDVAPQVAQSAAPLPSVAAAMQAALARQTHVLGYTGAKAEAPSKGLVDTSTGQSVSEPAPTLPVDPAQSERTDEEIEAEATAIIAALQAKRKPHSVNETSEVQK